MEQRVLWELGAFAASSPLLRLAGRGDRHPVLVLPGFTTSDHSMRPLRWFLRGQGYWVHGWGLGSNMGPTRATVEGLIDRLVTLHERHGEPVTLVGMSLGCIFARELARLHPHAVRQVVTLGSPFRLRPGDRSNASYVYDQMAVRFVAITPDADDDEEDREPLTMPSTSIYSRSDGIAPWASCLEAPGDHRENIEVRSSHNGLAVHPAVLLAVADRLAQPEGEWRPFRRPPASGAVYPEPAWYEPARRRPRRSLA